MSGNVKSGFIAWWTTAAPGHANTQVCIVFQVHHHFHVHHCHVRRQSHGLEQERNGGRSSKAPERRPPTEEANNNATRPYMPPQSDTLNDSRVRRHGLSP